MTFEILVPFLFAAVCFGMGIAYMRADKLEKRVTRLEWELTQILTDKAKLTPPADRWQLKNTPPT